MSHKALESARDGVLISPHATNALPEVTRAVLATVSGNAAVRFVDSVADVSITVIAGVIYPFHLSHVRVSGTTATLVALR